MDWMKLTVLTTTLASDLVSQLLIDAGSAGTDANGYYEAPYEDVPNDNN